MNNSVTNETFTKITCGVQAYHWGRKGTQKDSLVYDIYRKAHQKYKYDDLRNKLKQTDNFAEFWMGDHVSLPAQLDGKVLNNLHLPYLFKVLSVDQVVTALSIQVHPNREQAKKLHQLNPQIYPDENHKPEMAIAIGDFFVLSGFAPKERIIENVERNPHVLKYIGEGVWNFFKQHEYPEDAKIFKDIVCEILQWSDNMLFEIINDLHLPQSPCENAIKKVMQNYKLDVGVIFLLLLNHLKLKNGQALLMDSGQIHAYLDGNCIECKELSEIYKNQFERYGKL